MDSISTAFYMMMIFFIEGKSCKTFIELPQLRDMNDVIGASTYLSKVILKYLIFGPV